MADADRSRDGGVMSSGLPGGRADGRMDRRPAHRRTREDDVTDPGSSTDVPDADRAEQEALVDPPAVTSAGDANPPPEDVPEADALEQQLSARPGEAGSPLRPVGDREANEADVLEQAADVPLDEDDAQS
jgi:hypothetical protein